uniref:RGP1 homolog, RAB6A GEF complex partner 1 n=1 Tax=Zonotrichia albicollis TaxID=44394 RepID=A0A8D2QF15_ZONAL
MPNVGFFWQVCSRTVQAMIEVVAKLGRGPVFLAGEVLECVITFTNPLSASSTSASSEMLAWASAQIHCQFHASENRVALPPSDGSKHDVQAENETVFVPNRGERGQCILSTPPKILFCDLRLDPGESKSYSYCETLPVDGPPSFRGQSVKYVYKLTIGCQRVNSPIKLLRVPFRVLVLHGLKDYQFPQDEAVAPSNPFLEEEEGLKKDSRLADLATELLMVATSRRSLHLYNISNTRGKVGTFCIFKTVYKIGEDVIGTFNFSEGDIPCLQFSVSLQTEESIQEEFQRRRGQPVSFTVHARHQEYCLHTAQSSFSLPIPLSSTPGFTTNIGSCKGNSGDENRWACAEGEWKPPGHPCCPEQGQKYHEPLTHLVHWKIYGDLSTILQVWNALSSLMGHVPIHPLLALSCGSHHYSMV